jgi:hypothetical protein
MRGSSPALLDDLGDLLAHRGRATDDRRACVGQLAVGDRPQLRSYPEVAGIADDRLDSPDVDVSRQREGRRWDRTEPVAKMRLQMLTVEPLRLRVGVCDAHRLKERETVGVVVAAFLISEIPEAIEDPSAGERRAEPAEVGEHVLAVEYLGQRARRAAARHPERRARLLQRTRPDVHERVARVLPVPGERLARRPGLLEQLPALPVAQARLDRRDPADLVRVIAETHRHPRNQPPAAEGVQKRVLLRDLQRLPGLAERSTKHVDRRVKSLDLGGMGNDCRRQVRVRGDVVGGLAVLADRYPVKATAGRVEQFLDV